MTDRLSLYNGALEVLGERAILTLNEDRAPRRYLDGVWNRGAVDYVLGTAQWKFARRSVEMIHETGIESAFGFQYAYELPADHIRTVALCMDQYFKTPVLNYNKEQNYLFADIEPLYMCYVSNHADFGGDLSIWPADFTAYVEAYLAFKICKKLNQSETDKQAVFSLMKRLLSDAKSSDAQEGPTIFPPAGSFTRARHGGKGGSGRDGGNRNQLIG